MKLKWKRQPDGTYTSGKYKIIKAAELWHPQYMRHSFRPEPTLKAAKARCQHYEGLDKGGRKPSSDPLVTITVKVPRAAKDRFYALVKKQDPGSSMGGRLRAYVLSELEKDESTSGKALKTSE
jgi:hypothetical protein